MVLCNKFLHKFLNSVFDDIIIFKATFAFFTGNRVLFHHSDTLAGETFETQDIFQPGFNEFFALVNYFFLLICHLVNYPLWRVQFQNRKTLIDIEIFYVF